MLRYLLLGFILLAAIGSDGQSRLSAAPNLDEACVKAVGYRVSGGRAWALMDVEAGLKFCRQATADEDASGEAWAAFGRVLLKTGCDNESKIDPKICKQARQAFNKAAGLNVAEGYFGLGNMYWRVADFEGKGKTPRELYLKAIELKPMGLAYYVLSDSYRFEDKKKSRAFLQRAFELNNELAVSEVGLSYVKGDNGYKKDVSKGLKLLKKAVKLGSASALSDLGDVYYYGHGVRVNDERAADYYRRAIKYKSGYGAFALAKMYLEQGLGRPDREKAKKYFLLGHKWGDCNSPLTAIGDSYYEELGPKKNSIAPDYKVAAKWYHKALEAGEYNAVDRLITLYRQGLGVEQSDEKADQLATRISSSPFEVATALHARANKTAAEEEEVIYFHQKAADAGVGKSYAFLSEAYTTGYGFNRRNATRAAQAYLLALTVKDGISFSPDQVVAKKKNYAGLNYGYLVQLKKQIIISRMKHAGLFPNDVLKTYKNEKFAPYLDLNKNDELRSKRLAFLLGPYKLKWISPADGGFHKGEAYFTLATRYFREKKFKQAFLWMQRCAWVNNPVCVANMASMYAWGDGVKPNLEKTQEWVDYGIKLNDGYIYAHIGELYESGKLGPVDLEKAVSFFRKSAQLGHPRGQSNFAYMLGNGRGVPKDLANAYYWYSQAAAQGQGRGLFAVGVYYDNGYWVSKDKARALTYFKKSKEKGYKPAIEHLAKLGVKD